MSVDLEKEYGVSTQISSQPYRLATVIVCWLLSGFAVFGTFVFFANIFIPKNYEGELTLIGVLNIAWVVVQAFAWVALLVMSVGWVQNRKVHRMWAISGTIAGVVSLVPLPPSIVFASPGIALALVLVSFHLAK